MNTFHAVSILVCILLFNTVHAPGCEAAGSLIIYSGRSEDLIGPLIEQFRAASGMDVRIRYGKTVEMAATILEEGKRSPADLFIAQDAGALGALSKVGRLQALPDELLEQVDASFRSPKKHWVGVSGRARVVVYNTNNVTEEELPDDIFGFCDQKWKGRLGWAPANASFQAFILPSTL